MTKVRICIVLTMALSLAVTFCGVVLAQAGGEGSGRRGFRMSGRDSLMGLLARNQVQTELSLSEAQVAKVSEIGQTLREEMSEQLAGLREIEDRAKRRAAMAELAGQLDQKAREPLRELLTREQITRLYQIRMQVRGALASLNNRFVARRLELAEEQQTKLSELQKETQKQTSEMSQDLREQSQEQRREAMQKLRQTRNEANEKALGLLTDEQKSRFEEMKGEKFELQRRARRQ